LTITVPIFVLTSDKYLDALRPFAYLFNKYWSKDQPVTVAGFTPPEFELPDNFTFYSIGDFSEYPVGRWSDALIDLLNHFSNINSFCLMLEDYWLTRPVDTTAVSILYSYMEQFRYVLKMCLTGDRLYSAEMTPYGNVSYIDLILSSPQSQYQMSMMAGLWSRELLLSVLVPGETPWEVELNGTPRVRERKDDLIVLGTRQWPIRHCLAYRGGDPSKLNLSELSECDIKELTDLGYIPS